MVLKKTDLVDSVKDQLGFTRKQSIEAVESFIEIIKQTLASGEDILISGFGKFYVRKKGEWWGRNIVTGEKNMIAPRRVVRFKCSQTLRDRVNVKD